MSTWRTMCVWSYATMVCGHPFHARSDAQIIINLWMLRFEFVHRKNLLTFWSMKKVKYLNHYDVVLVGTWVMLWKYAEILFVYRNQLTFLTFFYDFDISFIRKKSLMKEYMILVTLDLINFFNIIFTRLTHRTIEKELPNLLLSLGIHDRHTFQRFIFIHYIDYFPR